MPNLKLGGRLLSVLRELSCWEGGVGVGVDEGSEVRGEETRTSCSVAAIFGTWVRFSRRCVERGPLLNDQR